MTTPRDPTDERRTDPGLSARAPAPTMEHLELLARTGMDTVAAMDDLQRQLREHRAADPVTIDRLVEGQQRILDHLQTLTTYVARRAADADRRRDDLDDKVEEVEQAEVEVAVEKGKLKLNLVKGTRVVVDLVFDVVKSRFGSAALRWLLYSLIAAALGWLGFAGGVVQPGAGPAGDLLRQLAPSSQDAPADPPPPEVPDADPVP